MTHDDRQLVSRIQAGDHEAFGELYDRYAALIRAVCHDTTGDLNESQELTQEVFVRAYQGIGRLREPERAGGWLVGIARIVCRRWIRQAVEQKQNHQPLDFDNHPLTEQTDDADDQTQYLHQAMAKLDENERLALHLFYLNEQSAERARSVLGLSRSGFYKLMKRARVNLAKEMSKWECVK